jgi:hypothetical protein
MTAGLHARLPFAEPSEHYPLPGSRAIEVPFPMALVPFLERYLSHHRPLLNPMARGSRWAAKGRGRDRRRRPCGFEVELIGEIAVMVDLGVQAKAAGPKGSAVSDGMDSQYPRASPANTFIVAEHPVSPGKPGGCLSHNRIGV